MVGDEGPPWMTERIARESNSGANKGYSAYILSPLDMAGMIGMAQTLAVHHYGYHTLKVRQIQFHGPALVPSYAAAVLDWGLDTPFTSLDKPPPFFPPVWSITL